MGRDEDRIAATVEQAEQPSTYLWPERHVGVAGIVSPELRGPLNAASSHDAVGRYRHQDLFPVDYVGKAAVDPDRGVSGDDGDLDNALFRVRRSNGRHQLWADD